MPKVAPTALNCLFAVIKPSGPPSMTIVNTIKPLISSSHIFAPREDDMAPMKRKFKKSRKGKAGLKHMVKVGTGGTLDPLADGVLVLGIGDGTKQLGAFLDCEKEYKTTCLLGCETDSYDSEGVRVRVAPWSHVTRQKIEEALHQFRGEIMQTPPLFSALKMDGKPLYEYARKGIPIPRPIPARKVTVHSLEIVDWKDGSDHQFRWPEKELSSSDKENMKKAFESAAFNGAEKPPIDDEADSQRNIPDSRPPTFVLRMKVSGGTYVRSIAHDIGHAVGSAAHVVALTRIRQGDFTLEPETEKDKACIPWEIFEEATKEDESLEEKIQKDEDGHRRWETEVLGKLLLIEKLEKGTKLSAARSEASIDAMQVPET